MDVTPEQQFTLLPPGTLYCVTVILGEGGRWRDYMFHFDELFLYIFMSVMCYVCVCVFVCWGLIEVDTYKKFYPSAYLKIHDFNILSIIH